MLNKIKRYIANNITSITILAISGVLVKAIGDYYSGRGLELLIATSLLVFTVIRLIRTYKYIQIQHRIVERRKREEKAYKIIEQMKGFHNV